MTKEIMNRENPRWEEFCERLEGKEGCNFTKEGTWNCKGGRNKELATAIMEKMGNIDIELSKEYFEASGGYCDCEILFNVKG